MTSHVVPIYVRCPSCGDVNRAARRACKACDHTGRIVKYVPFQENETECPGCGHEPHTGWCESCGCLDDRADK